MSTYKELHDIATRYQVYLERIKAGELRRVPVALQRLDKAVTSVLRSFEGGTYKGVYTPRQLEGYLAQVRAAIQQATAVDNRAFMANLKAISSYSSGFEHKTLELILPPDVPGLVSVTDAVAWVAATQAPIQATGQLLEPFVSSWAVRAQARVEAAIRTGVAQGKTTDDIVRVIRGTKARNFKDGIIAGQTRRDLEAVVRTSVQHVAAQARQSMYDANDDLIEGYMWISTLDSRTTQVCKSLDHQIFKVGEGPMPPIHINCRSTTIPIIKGIDVLSYTQRSSKGAEGGAQVAAKLSYYEWLKTQPAAFQDDALGPVRAALFRNGGLSAEEFARLNLDRNFQPLTLAEMRAKEPSAFARAGL